MNAYHQQLHLASGSCEFQCNPSAHYVHVFNASGRRQVRHRAFVPVTSQDTGVFHQKTVSKSMQEAMATDPTMMVDMMKKNLTGIVPQVRIP
jgi:hypothetical protein